MIEVMQLVTDVHGMIQAVGGLTMVEHINFGDYAGVPETLQEQARYGFTYASEVGSIQGFCDKAANTLQCHTHFYDGKVMKTVTDIVAISTPDMSKAVMTFAQEKVQQMHITIDPNKISPIQLIQAFKTQ